MIKSFVIKHENPPSKFISYPNSLMQRFATFFLLMAHSTRKDIGGGPKLVISYLQHFYKFNLA